MNFHTLITLLASLAMIAFVGASPMPPTPSGTPQSCFGCLDVDLHARGLHQSRTNAHLLVCAYASLET
jgi:hypothetical protein